MTKRSSCLFGVNMAACSIAWSFVLLLGVSWSVPCAVGQDEPAATDEKEAAAEAPAEEPEKEPDPFLVPDGSVEEILAYMKKLSTQRPKARTYAAYLEFQQKQNGALVEAADKALAAEPSEAQVKEAVGVKLKALSALVRTGDDEATEKLKAMPEELKKLGLDELVRTAQNQLFGARAAKLSSASAEEADKLVEEIQAFVAEGELNIDDLRLAMSTAQGLERSGSTEKAAKAYTAFGKILADSKDETVADYSAKLEGAGRRIALVGNEMPLEGVTLEGEALDWSQYEGKVVLVDFWATWCGPCLAEIPNMQKNFDAYHDLGFDIIGISVDRDRAALEKFNEDHDHHWTVLFDEASADLPDVKSMGTHYGVFGIPTFVLIGKDGKVAALNPRGARLGEELEKLLGPPPADDDKDAQDDDDEEDDEDDEEEDDEDEE